MELTTPGAPRASRVLTEPLREIGARKTLGRGTWESLTEVFAHRELLRRLVSREIRAKYKDSSLGILWSLARPLVQLAIYYVAIGQFLGAARGIPDFAIFVFTGLTIWALFSEIVSAGTGSILANAGLIKKVYLPREIFPLSVVGSSLFNFLIQFTVLIAATIVLGAVPLRIEILYAPLAVLLMVVLGTAVALVLSALNVYLRDIQYLIEIFLLVIFWASPIVYSASFVHDSIGGSLIEQIYFSNPITLAALGMQRAMWVSGGNDPSQYWPPDLGVRMLVAIGISFLALLIAQRVFARLQDNFAQEL